ncbi:MAG: DUF362 domain-containing protein [Bacteroidales bacterium]|nr:DUF362 domain-containing protein [Bacteroidales bacterium]
MKKVFLKLFGIIATVSLFIACGNDKATETSTETATENEAVVYMTNEISAQSLIKIYETLGIKAEGKVGIKISTGDGEGKHTLSTDLIEPLIKQLNAKIIECNTAYTGTRHTSELHHKTITQHGWDKIADVDIMDEDGEIKLPVTDGKHLKYDIVGSHINNYDFIINLAHFKGHQMAGFGGVLKNQSIGIASTNGKAYIHSAGTWEKMEELWEKHIAEQDDFTESMAEAAKAVADKFNGKIIYIAVMNNMSIDCDCNAHPAEPLIKDYGILASTDPVALDKACVDIIYNMEVTADNNTKPLIERIEKQKGTHILDYAEEIGLGTKKYTLKKID